VIVTIVNKPTNVSTFPTHIIHMSWVKA